MSVHHEFFNPAATLAAALIARLPADTVVSPEEAARLFQEVHKALMESLPKGKATVVKSPF